MGSANELWSAADEDHPRLIRIRAMLLRLWQSFELPANPLDQLTELLGGADRVAEMTGRKGQLIRDEEDGKVHYQHRRTEVTPLALPASHTAPPYAHTQHHAVQ